MGYAFCVVLGFLLGIVFGNVLRKPRQKTAECTEEEKRRSEKAWREYRNFMNYDGFPQQEDE